jgi:hypothetical protein
VPQESKEHQGHTYYSDWEATSECCDPPFSQASGRSQSNWVSPVFLSEQLMSSSFTTKKTILGCSKLIVANSSIRTFFR